MKHPFDRLTKGLAQSVTRRQALKKFGVGLAGMALACFGLANDGQAGTTACLPTNGLFSWAKRAVLDQRPIILQPNLFRLWSGSRQSMSPAKSAVLQSVHFPCNHFAPDSVASCESQ